MSWRHFNILLYYTWRYLKRKTKVSQNKITNFYTTESTNWLTAMVIHTKVPLTTEKVLVKKYLKGRRVKNKLSKTSWKLYYLNFLYVKLY